MLSRSSLRDSKHLGVNGGHRVLSVQYSADSALSGDFSGHWVESVAISAVAGTDQGVAGSSLMVNNVVSAATVIV